MSVRSRNSAHTAVAVVIIKAVIVRYIPAAFSDLICFTASCQDTVATVCYDKAVQMQDAVLYIILFCCCGNCADHQRSEQSAGCSKEKFAHRLRHWFHVLSCQRNTRPPGQHSFLAIAVSVLQSLSSAFVCNRQNFPADCNRFVMNPLFIIPMFWGAVNRFAVLFEKTVEFSAHCTKSFCCTRPFCTIFSMILFLILAITK